MKDKLNFSVQLKMQGKDIFSVFSAMIGQSAVHDKDAALDLIKKRESLGPTAIGDGIAVPHSKIPGLKEPDVVIGVLAEPVEYCGNTIRIIIMLLLPEDSTAANVELLSSLVSAVSTERCREKVLRADDVREVEEVFLR